MAFFKDLKFGGGSIGTFDNSIDSKQVLLSKDYLQLDPGNIRTDGVFAPAQEKTEDGHPNTNKPTDWEPTFKLTRLSVKKEDGSEFSYSPGFLPPSYLSKQILDKERDSKTSQNKGQGGYSWNPENAWIGHLLSSHIESKFYTDFTNSFVSLDTNQRIKETTTKKTEKEPYSARDFYIRFNDQRTDYFRHNLHIDGYTDLKSGKNARESFDGTGDSFRLASYTGTPFENNDPVIYGFEIIFDTFSSPLLNGSVEDFIEQFSYVSEIASRAIVIDDFKRQFSKLFRTKGSLNRETKQYSPENILINKQRDGQSMVSIAEGKLNQEANSDSRTNLYRPGKKAYLGYYLQKIDGLANLSESNTSDPTKRKYITDYGKDVIKLTFLEDVSATMGALAHLYKLLYWSKPNGKNIIPENLLRFNCDIIISECRNFNRVRKSANTGNLEIIKDNVSRYIYQLRECQFYFDKMPHDDSVDMGSLKTQDTYEVSFDYKYSATKFEKWVPSLTKPGTDKKSEKFGQYVGYNNGAIWKIGNKGMRDSAFKDGQFITEDKSVPRFYTVNTNTIRENGVTKPIILEEYKISSSDIDGNEAKRPDGVSGDETPTTAPTGAPKKTEVGDDEEASGQKTEDRKGKTKEMLDQFKENSKKVAVNTAKKAAKFVFSEVNNQISTRAKMLEDTINKARNLLGMGGLKNEPKRVYPRPYTPHSFGIFFDVRNDLFNFVGEEVAGIIAGGMQTLLPGTQLNVPFKMPNIGATLDKLTKKFSLYDAEAKLIASLKSKGPKMPFYDQTKHSKKWAGKSINRIYNSNTEFKYPVTTENTKYGGGFGVLALSFMKPKGNIFSDGNSKPATMLDTYSKPGKASGKGSQRMYIPIGTKDFNKIGFGISQGNNHQKYPVPLTQNIKPLKNILNDNTSWKYSMSSVQFPVNAQKYQEPTTMSKGTLAQIRDNNTNIGKKYGTKNLSNIQFPSSAQEYPSPLVQGNATLHQMVKAGTKWNYPVNDKKFGT